MTENKNFSREVRAGIGKARPYEEGRELLRGTPLGDLLLLPENVIVLSSEAYEPFVNTLDNPPEPSEGLIALFNESPPWIE